MSFVRCKKWFKSLLKDIKRKTVFPYRSELHGLFNWCIEDGNLSRGL